MNVCLTSEEMACDFESFGFVILEWISFVWTCHGMYQHVFEYQTICLSTMLIKGLLYALYSHEIPDTLDDVFDWIIFALFIAQTLQFIFSTYLKLTFVFNYQNPLDFDDEVILKVARGMTLILTSGTIA